MKTVKKTFHTFMIVALLCSLLNVLPDSLNAETAHANSVVPYSQAQIDNAVTEGLLWYQLGLEWDWHSLRSGAALSLLTAAAAYNPNHQASNGTPIKNRILQHIRNIIVGGKEPGCSGGLDSSAINQAIQSLAIVKTIPEIWNQLTQAEKDKITLIMQACLVASHWVHDDNNNFYTGINQLGNTHKSWNPNHIEGGVGMGIAASYYLGGATAANNFLLNFNYDNFMAQVQSAGLTGIHWVFSQTGKSALEAATRDTYTYNGYGLNQPFYWLKTLADKMYNGTVAPTGAGGKAYIVNGASSLPNQGQLGMANEFASVDGSGQRSDIQYVSKGWNNSLLNRFALEHFNGWGTGGDRNAVANKYQIGSTDFIYKITNGYHSYSNGANRGILYAPGLHNIMGFNYLKELWDKEYGGGGASVTKYEAENAVLTGVSAATSKAGYSGTGYIVANSFDQTGDKIAFTVTAASAGQYQLKVRYASDSNKQQYLFVNGVSQSNLLLPNSSTQWATAAYGNIQLNAGSNTIEIRKWFGWSDIDYIEISPAL